MEISNADKGILFKYIDENDFNRKLRSVRKYNMKACKYIYFKFKKDLVMKDGKYILQLPADDLFVKVYGKLELIYSIHNNVVVFEDIKPNDILLAGFQKDLDTYKGVMVRDEKDRKKIDILLKLRELESK